jgi:Zn-dependent protease
MLLGSPADTPYDLRFRLAGIPVRVHPLFWLIMALLSGDTNDLKAMAIFIVCAFVSVVVHEMGHGLSSRMMGEEPIGIVLYAMGGFCALAQHRLSPWQRVFVLICGPGAGFVLFGLVLGYVALEGWPASEVLHSACLYLIYINLIWGILNLFPLWPLDGGQITTALLSMVSPRNGTRWAHILSLLVAGGLSLWRFSAGDLWMGVWFAYFGVINFQILQSLNTAYSYADEGEWWRR